MRIRWLMSGEASGGVLTYEHRGMTRGTTSQCRGWRAGDEAALEGLLARTPLAQAAIEAGEHDGGLRKGRSGSRLLDISLPSRHLPPSSTSWKL